MSSVAEAIRDEQRRDVLRLTTDERMRLALRLGEEGLALFINANKVDPAEAAQALRRAGQLGRRPCRCIEELLE